MAERKFEYGSPELWSHVDEILARPSRVTKPLRQGLTWATSGRNERAIFLWPGEREWKVVEGYRIAKGARSDGLLISNLHRAINTGRITLEEIQEILAEMFGERSRHAWDEPWRILDEAVCRYGGCLSYRDQQIPKSDDLMDP